MDINFLRGAAEGQDINYKTLVWNLSQNVDRETGASKPGLCPCLTPNMVPYVTNRGGPLIGHEVLALQGIPVDDLLLTRESTDQMADLAGNAMTSTIVGTCLLAALLLGRDYLVAFEQPTPAQPTAAEAAASSKAKGKTADKGGMVTSNGKGSLETGEIAEEGVQAAALVEDALELTAMASELKLGGLLDLAARSARMCVSEGRDGTALDVLKCADCGVTVSKCCAGHPEHTNLAPIGIERVAPTEFEGLLKGVLPMCMKLSGVGQLDELRPKGALVGPAPGAVEPEVNSSSKASKKLKAAASAEGGGAGKAEGKAKAEAKGGEGGKAKAEAAAAPKPKPAMKQMGLGGFFKPKPAEPEPDVVMEEAADADADADAEGKPPAAKKVKGPGGGPAKPLAGDEALWADWTEALRSLENERFYFNSVTRGETWSATYTAAHGTLRLILTPTSAEWQLYATPPSKRGHLRTLLLRPVARMRIDAAKARGVTVGEQLLSGKWELCLPALRTVSVVLGALGEPVDSWQASIGLTGPGWEGHSRYRRWSVRLDESALDSLDADVSGEYELLDNCGGAMNSLHKRVSGGDGKPLYLFLDPSRTGKGNADSFVFATSFGRMPYGESRSSIAELSSAWRPWEPTPGKVEETRGEGQATKKKTKVTEVVHHAARQAEEVLEAKVHGLWRAAPAALAMTPVRFDSAKLAMPAAPPNVDVAPAQAADAAALAVPAPPPAVPLVRCAIPLMRSETADWPQGPWGLISLTRSKATFDSIAWITERLGRPAALSDWAEIDHSAAVARWVRGESPCEACAPAMPKLEWVSNGKKIVAVEDPVQAGAYEQRLKRRPPAFVVERRAERPADGRRTADGGLTADGGVVGHLRIAANPTGLAMRALSLLTPSGLAEQTTLDWRLVHHSDQPVTLVPLQLSSNKRDAPAPQPPHFSKFSGRSKQYPVMKLRIEQQRSLSWMLAQEADDAPPFVETEVAEAVLPALHWRLEARGRMPHIVRGGVLADEVGYGKTVITIALIDSTLRDPLPPPPPLRADGFIPLKATLVLAPSHLLRQWPREVEKFSGGALKCVTIATMVELNKLTIKELQSVDVVVCSITMLRNDLYFSRLANLAGAGALPNAKASQRHFGAAYGTAMDALQEQVARLTSGEAGIEEARQAVLDGQARRKAARKGSKQAASLGNTANRLASGVELNPDAGLSMIMKGKKATYAAEKKTAKAAKEEEVVEEEEEEEEESEGESEGESEEEGSEEESEDEGSDLDEKIKKAKAKASAASKKRKVPASKTGATVEKDEADPWGLMSGKCAKDFTNMKAAPLEVHTQALRPCARFSRTQRNPRSPSLPLSLSHLLSLLLFPQSLSR